MSIDPAVLFPFAAAVITVVVASGVTYATMLRAKSGRIKSTEADDLWEESSNIRRFLREEVSGLKTELVEMREENALLRQEVLTLRTENSELKTEVLKYRQENAALTAKVNRLEAENTDLRDRVRTLPKAGGEE